MNSLDKSEIMKEKVERYRSLVASREKEFTIGHLKPGISSYQLKN